jgi:NAD-specific glutamate dehydrogenase
VDSWLEANRAAVERFLLVVDDIRTAGPADLTTLSVAMREARALGASAARRSID